VGVHYKKEYKLTTEIFNKLGTSHITGDYPLFGGESPSLYDGINVKYPFLYNQKERLRQQDWAVDDVDLTQTRMDLLRCDKNLRNIMLYNLAYQWELDSIASNISTLLAPFVTNWEYAHLLARIGENEMLHSETYSSIVRQCVPDPQEVFNMVYKNEQVLDRAETVHRVLSELKEVGNKYVLKQVDFMHCMPYILKGLVAIYTLERISFMSSFACTFALAEQEYFVGAARLVQKILMDELIHFQSQAYVLKDILLKSGEWKTLLMIYQDEVQKIVDEVVGRELSWNKYLFSEGRSMVGLNEGILNDWIRFNAQEVYDNLNIIQPFRKTVTNPLPWFETNWMDLNSQQTAPMETNPTNYIVSAISTDVDSINLSLDLDL
jgi:ribonucleoside-diphosphate reductase beta chain